MDFFISYKHSSPYGSCILFIGPALQKSRVFFFFRLISQYSFQHTLYLRKTALKYTMAIFRFNIHRLNLYIPSNLRHNALINKHSVTSRA